VIGRRRTAHASGAHDEAPEYWVTYSDLLVTLLMVFALLLFLTLSKMQHDVQVAKDVVRGNARAVAVAAGSIGGAGAANVLFDPRTQSLSVPDEVLFGFGSAALRPEAEQALGSIATGFLRRLLTDPETWARIEAIVVEGHTDTVGTYLSNLDLSQRRAQAVMRAVIQATDGAEYAPRLRELLVASGRSEVEALRAAQLGSYDAAKARRIVLRVRFRNDELLQQIFSRFPQASAP